MKNGMKRISHIVSNAIFTILVLIIAVLLIYVIYIKVLESQGRLGDAKFNFYTILTQSMYPTIEAGDIIVTYKNSDDIYNTKDIITFVSPSDPVTITHRIIEVSMVNGEYYYRTKGDHNNTADRQVIPSDNVIGRVVLRIPKAGYIQQFLVSRTGWIVAVVLPCLGIIIYDIIKIMKKLMNKDKQIKSDTRVIDAKNNLKEVLNDERK